MTTAPIRRPPPRFRRVTVDRTEPISPHMVRVVLAGPDLEGFRLDQPAASVRVLLPVDGTLVMPEWNGNEFLLPDGRRPPIRTFTPRRFVASVPELHVDVVLHEGGVASDWARTTRRGDPAAVSGPGRGYLVDPDAKAFLLLGDETAIPAICQLLEHLPEVPITVHVEIAHPDARVDLHREVAEHWHVLPAEAMPGDTLLAAVRQEPLQAGMRIWAAGEAAGMQRIRKHLFGERGVERSHATVRGYWKRGRAGT